MLWSRSYLQLYPLGLTIRQIVPAPVVDGPLPPGVPVYGRQQGTNANEVIPTAEFEDVSDDHRGGPADDGDLDALRLRAQEAEEEVTLLRRRLQESPRRVQTLEEKLLETKGQLAQAISQNEKLTFTLQTAKEHVANLRDEVEKLTQPPAAYGTTIRTGRLG